MYIDDSFLLLYFFGHAIFVSILTKYIANNSKLQ